MCKKLIFLVSVIGLLGMVNNVLAVDAHWIGDPNAKLSFCDPCGWDGGSVPGVGDTAYINPPPYQGPVIDCVVDVNNVFGPRNNSDVNQVMDIVGGNVDAGLWLIGDSGKGTATVNISGDPHLTLGGVEGVSDGTTVINITDNAKVDINGEVRLVTDPNATLIMNISGNANITSSGKWRLADNGKAIVNISGNPNIVIYDQWRNGDDEAGYVEIHMSGGSLYTDRYLCIYDDGSAMFDFSGGTVEVIGLTFSGRNCEATAEINVSGTADITTYDLNLSYGGCGPSTMNISGGRFYCGGSMKMASGTAKSTLNMTGGSLVVTSRIYAPFGESAEGVINLRGGTIECREFWHGGANWRMDVCGGTMIIDSNVVPEIEADIATGHIVACSGGMTDYVAVDFNNVNPGKTTVWAVKGPIRGDFDKDGVVDWNDLAFLVEQWLDRCRADQWCDGRDINKSGRVDFDDFVIFALGWLETWP